ncbi:MAG: O-acetyl-ADP-ribose deacetylase [Pirellulales bacterium]|nr:O-acetyl-ADP-ribose deacetylase [Pirellulales bacterium]
MWRSLGKKRLELVQGDVTAQQVDALVNAANCALAGGGGVDGAVHRRGGPQIMAETRQRYPEGCPTGSAVVTRGGALAARYVIHAVGPVWRGGNSGEAQLLASAYRTSLALAAAHDCRTVALPALSTGAYGYPMDLAARVALNTVAEFLLDTGQALPELARFVLFDAGSFGAFSAALEELSAAWPHLQ